jgi:ethanolamine ammonia-lyase large subunit
MGLDVCSTFHMGIGPLELQALTDSIVKMAAPAYLMSVAGKADPMLGYLTTSYRDHPRLRMKVNKQFSSAMSNRLFALNAINADGIATGTPEKTAILYARFMKEGGNTRTIYELKREGLKKIAALKEKGCDLGYGFGPEYSDPPQVSARLDTIYKHARNALYATLDASVIRDCCLQHIDISTNSIDREDYLAHPASGELINERDSAILKRLFASFNIVPQIQIVISDGLNANAVNENLREVLPKLRWLLKEEGFRPGRDDVVIMNGRVRAGYHAAQLIEPEVLIHLIGERPGSGLNQLSVYITYGKDQAGNFRWCPEMNHSFTTAICSINTNGKTPQSAVVDMVKCVKRMIEFKCSGVTLGNKNGLRQFT